MPSPLPGRRYGRNSVVEGSASGAAIQQLSQPDSAAEHTLDPFQRSHVSQAAVEQELGDSSPLTLAREIAYSHHDWWDGTGYPFKPEGESIPLSARIAALADVYDALTTARPYKSAMSHHHASEIIASGVAKQFDPYGVGAFRLREKECETIAREMSPCDLERQDEHEPQNELMDQVALDRLQAIR